MAHFAELDENNNVLRVCVVDNNIETSDGPLGENDMHVDGETWCTEFFGGTWKQTSYTNSFRKQFAGHNMYYDNTKDKFMLKLMYSNKNDYITDKGFTSTSLNPQTGFKFSGDECCFFRIKIPKGSSCFIYPTGFNKGWFDIESELLLAPSKFKIIP